MARKREDSEPSPPASEEKPPTASGPPSRDFGYSLPAPESSPRARKEKRKQREYTAVEPAPRSRRGSPPPYVELHAASAFSFLQGASLPEDLLQRAAEVGLPAVALVDVNGV